MLTNLDLSGEYAIEMLSLQFRRMPRLWRLQLVRYLLLEISIDTEEGNKEDANTVDDARLALRPILKRLEAEKGASDAASNL